MSDSSDSSAIADKILEPKEEQGFGPLGGAKFSKSPKEGGPESSRVVKMSDMSDMADKILEPTEEQGFGPLGGAK